MTSILWQPLTSALMVTAFVTMMMMAVEYISVLTRGAFQSGLARSRWTQYLAAVGLGAIPGCLGPFVVVTLYGHRILPLGAVVGAMIATSGDEAFVMLALFPSTALWLTAGLALLGLIAAPIVDLLFGDRENAEPCPGLVVHEEDGCGCFPGIRQILSQWAPPSTARVILAVTCLVFLGALSTGLLGPGEWSWIRWTLLLVGLFGAFEVCTVPDHFLQEHLWEHVLARHTPRIFGWTFGVLLSVAILSQYVDLDFFIQENRWIVLSLAAMVGIIPESGPHLVFVTLFSEGTLPISILIASSIVQDGHGMLPLLAESRRDFLLVKGINLLIGLGVGSLLLALGL
ncbi:MAG: hypothetical protein GWO83_00510 [Bacteroidia bacterium]|nr:hypothetical protein [Bacteroidia bacterium]